jgi:hypothetical protein
MIFQGDKAPSGQGDFGESMNIVVLETPLASRISLYVTSSSSSQEAGHILKR